MISLFRKIIYLVIIIFVGLGVSLIFFNKTDVLIDTTDDIRLSQKSLALKKYLSAYQKPQRIEIFGLSNRFADEISKIKTLKMPQDTRSDFYISIQFFSDEHDLQAPLIAQIRFIDIKSGNLRKEESINLD